MSSPPPPAAATPAEASRGLVRKIISSMLLAALVFGGLALYSDLRELSHTARTFAGTAFLLGLGLVCVNYALRIGRWHYYLGQLGLRVPLGESATVFLAGFVMSVTPGKVGEVFKSLLLWESRGTSIARTAPIVIAERLTDLIALVVLTALGSLAFEHGIAVAATSAVMVAGLVLVCAYRPLGYLLLSFAERMPLLGKISHKLREAYDSLLEMTRPAPLLIGTAIGVVGWGMECISLYVILHGFEGVTMGLTAATFAYSASTIAGAVAMMPGGLGVTDIGMTKLLQTLGNDSVRPAVAAAATILVRVATLWFAVLVGALALGVYKAGRRRAAGAGTAAPS